MSGKIKVKVKKRPYRNAKMAIDDLLNKDHPERLVGKGDGLIDMTDRPKAHRKFIRAALVMLYYNRASAPPRRGNCQLITPTEIKLILDTVESLK